MQAPMPLAVHPAMTVRWVTGVTLLMGPAWCVCHVLDKGCAQAMESATVAHRGTAPAAVVLGIRAQHVQTT